MSQNNLERVLSVHHWTDTMFSFRTTRNPGLRFESGQFVMIGIEVNGKPLLRAYSIVSAHYDDELEFLSIKVPDGPLTSRLQHLKEGDTVIVGRKATGTLVIDNLTPGKRLLLLGTGTGLAPFMSVIRDPRTYENYEQVVLVHGCRIAAELSYRGYITETLPNDEYIGEAVREKLRYFPTVTREEFENRGRITDLIFSNSLFDKLGQPKLSAADDRVMLCGSPQMIDEFRAFFASAGFAEGSVATPGQFVVERAFVEK